MNLTGTREHAWWPYVLPMGAFLALTSAESLIPRVSGQPHPMWYPLAYAGKVVVVSVLACVSRTAWRDLAPRPSMRAVAIAVGLGLCIAVLWVGLESLPYPKLTFAGKRQEFNPYVMASGRNAFLAVRLFGLVLLVPLVEELFWRSFLVRWVIDSDFTRVPIGQVTPLAAVVASALFAAAHPEWLPALITGFAWVWLLWHTKSLSACVISHVCANLALGIYVLVTKDWRFW
jgi:CAAX prenyl protease-like protein